MPYDVESLPTSDTEPEKVDGNEIAARINAWLSPLLNRNAHVSSRPSWVTQGSLWYDTSSYRMYFYTGFDDYEVTRVVSVPSGPTDSGEEGSVAFDNDYMYVCVAANDWRRTSMADFWSEAEQDFEGVYTDHYVQFVASDHLDGNDDPTIYPLTWNIPPGAFDVALLIVAGGGSGGRRQGGGGGGAGGLIYIPKWTPPHDLSQIDLTVGFGGISPGVNSFGPGVGGEDSQFHDFVAKGGGAGGGASSSDTDITDGRDGGSGGGAGRNSNEDSVGGKGVDDQGHDGGDAFFTDTPMGSPGGGSAGPGASSLNGVPGKGGDGTFIERFDNYGSAGWFAAGGGGSPDGEGGEGGGGDGGTNGTAWVGQDGASPGSGGGGGGYTSPAMDEFLNADAGDGADGTVLIFYRL